MGSIPRRIPRAFISLGVGLAILGTWLATPALFAQTGPVQYGYDELGRLVIVVNGAGDAAIYNYDPVGNLLSIQRINAAEVPEPVAIYALSPTRGKAGTTVSILGKGFSPTPGQNTVTFTGGAVATVTGASPNGLRVTVPASALTGPISVTAPAGTAVSPVSFTIIGPLTVTPDGPFVAAGTSRQFSATGGGGATPPVVWTVNDIVGGNSSVGTISTTGLYSAPASVANQFLAMIGAADQSDLTAKGSTQAVVVPAGAQRLATARPVSVSFAQGTVSNSVHTAVSAVIGGTRVSNSLQTAVSVARGGQASATTGTAVSVNIGPVITAVSPAAGTRGATDLTVTLTGSRFHDATQVAFLWNNAPDPAISVALASVNPEGTEATLSISIATSAAVGSRVVRITTPEGASTVVGTGVNVFSVQ